MAQFLSVHGTDMFVGEVRIQGVAVTHEGAAVVPTNATYQRYKQGSSTPVDAAPVAASVSGNTVYANVPAGSAAGLFDCYFYFTVDTETVKARVQYRVLAIP